MSKLAQYPHISNFPLNILDLFERDLRKEGNEVLNEISILPEHVFKHDYSLSSHIGDAERKEVAQLGGDCLGHLRKTKDNRPETTNRLLRDFGIHVSHIL